MSTPDETALRYIADHDAHFTREAITASLAASGHDQAEIAAAWSAYDAGQRPPTADTGTRVASGLLMFVVFTAYAPAILLALAAASWGSGAPLILPLYAVAMVAGGLYSLYRLASAPTRDNGCASVAIAFAISVVIFVGLSGLCVAGLSSSRG